MENRYEIDEEKVLVITDREELYNKCENMEQLFDKYYLPLLEKHYSKTYKMQQKNKELSEKIEYLKEKIENKDKWCQLIADIGFDYDGYNDTENLKLLIDELVKYALFSRDNYDFEEFLNDNNNY